MSEVIDAPPPAPPAAPPAAPPPAAPPAAPPPAAPPAAPAGDWTGTLTPENKQLLEKNGWKDPNEVLKGYGALVSKLGLRRVAPLTDKSTEAEIKEFREIMGVPADAAGYKLPEGTEFANPDLYKALAPIAHKHNIPPAAYNDLALAVQKIGAEQLKAEKAAIDQEVDGDIAGLKQKWGASFEANQGKARAAAKALGLSDAKIEKIAGNTGAGDLLSMLHGLNEQYGIGREDGLHGAGAGGGFGVVDPDTAKAEIANIRASKEFKDEILGKRGVPEDHPLKVKLRRLEDIAYGTKPVATVGGGPQRARA